MTHPYYSGLGGHPGQDRLLTDRATFTESYAFIPRGAMRDIVASALPFWEQTRAFVLARPLSGFAETFSQYIMEVGPGGGSDRPDDDSEAEAILFVVEGGGVLTIDGALHRLSPGSYVYLPPETRWSLRNDRDAPLKFHWFRKAYQAVDGIDRPEVLVTSDAAVSPSAMPGCEGVWETSRFVDPTDMRHDMHVNIVTFYPGGMIPFCETHVMEHGLFVLQGKGVYCLNKDWVEVEAGDFMWLRAFCPQACYAGGAEPFRYLLYKDVNRHMPLRINAR
ncbi:bifunctional allantoicase/(S)-ureidoglycine aminohydrolase [Roseisalinus antarcticus]|uniref:Cupin type-2 domain-containing protein n=1 Tax=Roseisalinus antarcticus TaxID=254357 RepID=A0A1Y5T0J6_9RHOB|nr:bifunctional allantoicase/(S)-ureidoglycine aminohydrolase [Roseisalinus antarcticus]SLN49289.1 hypothetical protein ROA7023_02114 [Roseisalinus antarcticus]